MATCKTSWWNCSLYLFIWHLKKQQPYTQVYTHRVISFQLITIHYTLQYNSLQPYIIVTCIIIKCEQTSLIETKGSSSEYTAWEFCQRWNHMKIHLLKRWFKIPLPVYKAKDLFSWPWFISFRIIFKLT